MNELDLVLKRKNTNSIKWDFVNFMYPDLKHEVLPLWVADMDFPCAEEIIEGLKLRLDTKVFGYSSFDNEYYSILNNWFSKKYFYEVKKNEIFYSPGIVPALGILIRSLTSEKDGVIIQPPVYYPFKNMIINNNRKVVENNLIKKDKSYKIDFDDLKEKASNPNNKMLILCSPHNPVGRVWTEEEIEKIIDICIENDLYLVSDEIHCDLIRKENTFTSTGIFKDIIKEKLIICTAPSKSFNLAGLQLSNIIIFNKLTKEKWINEIMNKMAVSNPTPFAISATKAAYTRGEEWLFKVNEYIDSNLIFLDDYIKKNLPKVKYNIPEATYLAWLDFSEYEYSDSEITERLLNIGKVALDEGKLFGKQGEKFQRINVACPRSILESALEKIKISLE
jgi:cystathionine beta-lyase